MTNNAPISLALVQTTDHLVSEPNKSESARGCGHGHRSLSTWTSHVKPAKKATFTPVYIHIFIYVT
jgi:hypothetical protein